MKLKNIINIFFTMFFIYNTSAQANCLYHHKNKKEIDVYIHGKPVDIHIEGQSIQPTVNVLINMTIIEKC